MDGRHKELARKSLHIAMGGFAFLLRWLTWWQAALLALAALLNNLFVLPRVGGRRVYRGAAATKGHDVGIVLYPLSILALLLLLPGQMPIVAAAWALLAFGDGVATVAGVTLGRATGPLPWNRDKSWAGLAGFLLAGIPMSLLLYAWTSQAPLVPSWVVAMVVVGAIVAVVESLPLGIDDNIVVPLGGAALLVAASRVDPARLADSGELFLSRLPFALAVNLALAVPAYAAKSVDRSGFVHGVLVGTLVWVFGGPAAFLMLVLFFVLGTAATKVGYRTKQREGTAQEKGGRRGARHAWANVGAGVLFAFMAAATPLDSPWPALFQLALVAAFATAASDTLASEIGQAFGRRTYLVTTFRPVPRGTDGAVSLEGTLAGVAGSLLVGLAGYATGLCSGPGVGLVVVAAFVGTTLESYLGAWLERARQIDNEAQNFLNTVAGGLAALLLARWIP